jgi:hypothetical protein
MHILIENNCDLIPHMCNNAMQKFFCFNLFDP